MGRTLLQRLLLSHLAVIIVTLVAVALATSYLFNSYYVQAKERELVQKGREIADLVEPFLSTESEFVFPFANLSTIVDAQVLILDRQGLALNIGSGGGRGSGFMMRPQATLFPELERVMNGEVVTSKGFNARLNQRVLAVAVPVQDGPATMGAVILYTPIADFAPIIAALRSVSLQASTIAVLLAVLLGFFLSRSLSRPLKDMSKVSMAMAEGDFDQRVSLTGPDELTQLASSMNHLAENLGRTINALAAEKEKIAQVLANMQEAVIAVDPRGKTMMLNAEFGREAAASGVSGEDLMQAFPELSRLLDEVLEERTDHRGEITRVDGKVHYLASASPIPGHGETLAGAVAVLQDITEFRRLEQLRRDFVANVSHELRTPLTSIQAVLEAIREKVVTGTERERYLEVAHNETLRLKRLIQDLLDLSSLQSGKVQWELHAIDLANLTSRVAFKMGSAAGQKNIHIRTEVPEDILPALGNEDRIEQVLTNLVSNAIRYSPADQEVHIKATQEDQRIIVSVRDNGPGIADEDLADIWNRFHRVEKSRSRDEGGTGLGLAIVKEIVEAHGGRVSVSTTPGQGATFTFTLPAATD